MKSFKVFVVLVIFIGLSACKKFEELQEKNLNAGKKQTLYEIPYGDHYRNKLDISLPKDRDINTPVVIFIHGGAWIMGDKCVFIKERDLFADAGIACATINYRYASGITDVHHAEILEDIRTAVDFIASKSELWQVAPNRFGLVGQSAGGHLSMIAAYTRNADNRIKACASWAGPTNLIDPDQLNITASHEVFKTYVGVGLNNADDTLKYKEASPFWNITNTSVPTLLIHGTEDIGVPYSNAERMKAELDKNGVTSQFVTFEGSGHLWFGNDLSRARSITLQWFQEKL